MWIMVLLISIILGWTLYFMVVYSREAETRNNADFEVRSSTVVRSSPAARMKRERLWLNPKYASSIKCKYCEHYNSSGFCHMYPKGTTPDDACERFSLPLVASMGCAIEAAEGREFTRRPDGTYMIDLGNASK